MGMSHLKVMISTCDISVMVDQDWKISSIFNCIRNVLFICKFSVRAAACLMCWFALTASHLAVVCPTR